MKAIYIAGPYRAANAWTRENNIRNAERAGLRVAELGAVPVVPHTMFRFFDGTLTDEFWIDATKELLDRCDAAYFISGYRNSVGALGEFQRALQIGLPRLNGISDVESWLKRAADAQASVEANA